MTNITTSGGNIIFQDTVTGLTKQIGQNRLWISFKADTVNFLQVDIPTDGYDGTPFWSVRATNLTINGDTYTIEQLKNGEGLSDLFSGASFGYMIVDALPSVGEPNIIYLVYDDETGTYAEYLWLSQEEVWEELGSVGDVELTNYYTKSEVNTILNGYAEASDLATVATTGSYDDLSNKPDIPTVPTNVSAFTNDAGYLTEHQSLSNYYNKSQTDNLLNGKVNIGSLATVANSGSYNDLTDKPDLSTKQDVLVSGVNIKTINSQSLLGEGNINIEGGGGGTQVQSNWNETDTTSMAYIQNKPTNVSAFTNDAGYLTQHQSLDGLFESVEYDSSTKRINFKDKTRTVVDYVDASDFVVDGMVEDVRIENGNLVIDFTTDSGITDISIPLTDIFDPSNYYTKTEVDDLTADFASIKDVDGAVNDAKPYVYTIGETSIETFDEAKTALVDNGRGLLLMEDNGDYFIYHPASWKYDETGAPMFTFTYVANDGTVMKETAQKASDSRSVAYNTVNWTTETLTEDDTYWMTFEDDNVENFDDAAQAYNNGKSFVMVLRNGWCPLSVTYDDGTVEFSLSWIDFEGNIVAYNVQKTGDGKDNPYRIVWTDVSPEPASIDVDSTWVQGSTNPVESQLIQTALASKADSSALSDYATTTAMNTALAGKQDTLVSGTNIKTINNQSILGSGNITIEGGSQITVDSALSSTSENPVQNKVIYAAIGDIEAALRAINGTTNA